MLFQRQFHEGIRSGSITRTYRAWKAPRAKVGGRHRFAAMDAVEVVAVDQVAVGSIRDADARKAGFDSASDLVASLRRHADGRLIATSKVFRIRFRHARLREQPRAAPDTSAAALDELAAKLRAMDGRSRYGPWTLEVLELIKMKPRTAASKLAPLIGRDRASFKLDVRKLKKLGLTTSFEVGYELTAAGRKLLARLRAKGA